LKIKVGVIGLGFMGSAHARVYNELKDCELVAICDSDPNKKSLAKNYSSKFFTNSEDFFNQNMDAVSICTPTSMHKKIVINALNNNKHVLVEKPFSDNLAHGQEMAKKSKSTNRLLAVGYIERFNSAVKELKKSIDFSKIFSTVSIRFGPFPPRTKYCGVFIDLASHEIDLLNFLTQSNPKILYKHFSSKIENNFEDYAYISLQYDHIHSHIEVSWLPNYKLRIINLYGNNNFYTLNYAQQNLRTFRSPPKAKIEHGSWNDILWLSRHVEEEIPVLADEPLVNELQCFIDSIKKNEIISPLCTPNEGLQVLKVIEDALNR
jgi:UDP-N-acetylglucosamine 3-dehydrogenase